MSVYEIIYMPQNLRTFYCTSKFFKFSQRLRYLRTFMRSLQIQKQNIVEDRAYNLPLDLLTVKVKQIDSTRQPRLRNTARV